MLKSFKNINFILNKNNSYFDLYKEDIANYWNDFSKNTPEVFNGEVISVFDIRNLNGYYNINGW